MSVTMIGRGSPEFKLSLRRLLKDIVNVCRTCGALG